MGNVVIFGGGQAGRYLYDELLAQGEQFKVVAFLDNIQSGEYRGIPIKKPAEILEKLAEYEIDAVFLAAGAQKTLKLMIKTCRNYGVEHICMMHDIAGKCHLPLFENGELIKKRIRKLRFSDTLPSLAYFEVPITDNCNLNCKGCLFASNITDKECHVPVEQLKADAKRMKELFYDVPWIRILGGEPLMHPHIKEVLGCYRECFPDSEIDLCTNGLLIPKMDDSFWQCIKENGISVHVSGYKPTYNLLDKIDKVLSDQGIPYVILKREEFAKYYTNHDNNDMQKSYDKCMASGCYEVYRGRIATCSAMIAFQRFNEQFGTSYEVLQNEDWFDIHEEGIDPWEISRKLDAPSRMCRYCSDSKVETFEWEYSGTKQELRDFVIDE